MICEKFTRDGGSPQSMRMAQRQVRTVMADCPVGATLVDVRSIGARDASDDANEQTRYSEVAGCF